MHQKSPILTFCVYTWLIFARRFANTSHGISYPFLYRNSAVSPRALIADALASAIDPVMTHPTEEESLKMYETEDGSMSLSGTFFWDSTTAQVLPRTATEVIFAAVIALKAYSVVRELARTRYHDCIGSCNLNRPEAMLHDLHTYLVQSPLVREDCNVPIDAACFW